MVFDLLRTSLGKPKAKVIKILLDSGSSGTLAAEKYVKIKTQESV